MFVNQPSFSWANLFLCNTLACNCWPKLTVWFISAITPNAADWAGTCSDLWFIAGGGCTKYFATTSHEQPSSHTSISISSLCVSLLSRVQLFATPWIVAYEAPPSMGFSRQEYWSGLPFPSPGDLPIEPGSPALQTDALPSKPPGKPLLSSQQLSQC